jgi:hypothetical protein
MRPKLLVGSGRGGEHRAELCRQYGGALFATVDLEHGLLSAAVAPEKFHPGDARHVS